MSEIGNVVKHKESNLLLICDGSTISLLSVIPLMKEPLTVDLKNGIEAQNIICDDNTLSVKELR